MSRELFAPLVRACRTVDHTYVFQRKGSVWGFVKLIRKIRQTQFDWVLDLQGLFRSGVLSLCSQAKNKAGRSDAREGARWFYPLKAKLPHKGSEAHALEILMEFKRLFDKQSDGLKPLTFDTTLSESNRKRLCTPPLKRLMIFPESRRTEKEWPFFQELTGMLLQQSPNLQLVWVGTSPIQPSWISTAPCQAVASVSMRSDPGPAYRAPLIVLSRR